MCRVDTCLLLRFPTSKRSGSESTKGCIVHRIYHLMILGFSSRFEICVLATFLLTACKGELIIRITKCAMFQDDFVVSALCSFDRCR